MPFGLCTAGFIFSKVVREIVNFRRSRNLKVLTYIDDGLAGADSYIKALESSETVRTNLLKFGFVIAEEKCTWIPVQNLVWLGFEWDMKTGKLRVTQERIDRIIKSIENLLILLKKEQL